MYQVINTRALRNLISHNSIYSVPHHIGLPTNDHENGNALTITLLSGKTRCGQTV
jgi:hypothetical protein